MRRLVLIALLLGLVAAPAAGAAPPPDWRPGVAAARAYLAGRAGDVSFSLRTERRHWSHGGTTTYRSASVVKAMLLVAYLRRGDVRGRRLRGGERALLDPMIRRSDNDAADAVSARVGMLALSALARRTGMRAFLPIPCGAARGSPPTTRRGSSCGSTGSCRAATAPTRCGCYGP